MPRWAAALHPAGRTPRNADFGQLQETFLICAVATILVIRTQLWLTNYPQLGGRGLHIAHLLYGGAIMVIAIGILITFLGRAARRRATVIGGVGFGFFIDELGKFITADNNYFFKPAAALIYLTFVGLFLLTRAMQGRRSLSPAERLVNAIELLAEAADGSLDEGQKRRALRLLEEADPNEPLAAPVRHLVMDLDAIPAREPSAPARWAAAVRSGYRRLVERHWFGTIVTGISVTWAVLSAGVVFELVLSLGLKLGVPAAGYESDAFSRLSLLNWASLASSSVSAALVALGLHRLRRGRRLDAYRMFHDALLVSIFVTRVFSFVESQFHAVFGVAVDLLLLVTIRYMIEQERRLASDRSAGGRASEVGGVRLPSAVSS